MFITILRIIKYYYFQRVVYNVETIHGGSTYERYTDITYTTRGCLILKIINSSYGGCDAFDVRLHYVSTPYTHFTEFVHKTDLYAYISCRSCVALYICTVNTSSWNSLCLSNTFSLSL